MVFTHKPFRKNEEIYVVDPKPSWPKSRNDSDSDSEGYTVSLVDC